VNYPNVESACFYSLLLGQVIALWKSLYCTLTAKTSILAISEKQNAVKMGINEKRNIRTIPVITKSLMTL